jgi:hypothetical protein
MTPITIAVIGAIAIAIFSPVFSPLSESIKDFTTSNPITNITAAKTFDTFNQKVITNVAIDDTISSNSITFYFDSYLDPNHPMASVLKLFHSPSFECSFDGNEFEPCVSPKIYNNLNTESGHSFYVRSTGILGNIDTKPANFSFNVITSATVEGTVKNGSKPMKYVNYLVDHMPNPSGSTLDNMGGFRLEGISQGNHVFSVYTQSNENILSKSFYVPPGRQEVLTIDFNLLNMTPSSLPQERDTNILSKSSTPVTILDSSSSNKNLVEELSEYLSTPQGSKNIALEVISNESEPVSNATTGQKNTLDTLMNLFENESEPVSNATTGQKNTLDTLMNLFENESEESTPIISIGQSSLKISNPQNPFSTRIWIQTDDFTLSNIEKVEYYLHPTFTPSTVTSTSNLTNFEISFTNWGIFNLNAKVFFKDGTTRELSLPRENWKI